MLTSCTSFALFLAFSHVSRYALATFPFEDRFLKNLHKGMNLRSKMFLNFLVRR